MLYYLIIFFKRFLKNPFMKVKIIVKTIKKINKSRKLINESTNILNERIDFILCGTIFYVNGICACV